MDGGAVWLQTASSIPVYVTMGEYNIHVKNRHNTSIALTFSLFLLHSLLFQADRRVCGRFGWLELLSG